MSDELSPAQLKAMETIEKLLNLAANAGTPAEAALAAAKAQAMLAEHNLSEAHLEDTQSKQSAKREEAKVEGGAFVFQRELWKSVAELNFCHYWPRKRRYIDGKQLPKPLREHCLIGRVVNTRMSIAMASYLQGAIERLARERVGEEGWLMSSRWAWSYRKGAAQGVIDRIRDRRQTTLNKEERERRAAVKAKVDSAAGTALTIASFSKTEEEANYAFQHGEDALALRRETAAYYARAESAYTKWAKANPGEAAEKFEFTDEDGSKSKPFVSQRYRSPRGGEKDKTDWSAFGAGKADGAKIGLEPQAGNASSGLRRIAGKKDIYL